LKIAVIGATGLVGRKMLEVLSERKFPVNTLIPVGSARSVGKSVAFGGRDIEVVSVSDAVMSRPQIAIFSAGSSVSKEWAPKFAEIGAYVIDNSSAWRMEAGIPLVVPEVNSDDLEQGKFIIANPNCSTIQMVVALSPLHRRWGIKRLVISTYQSITGTGKDAVTQYEAERDGVPGEKVYPHQIFENCIPHCDVFMDNAYTREEMKLVHETRKIMHSPDLAITATAVRVPVLGGHSESVNVELSKEASVSAMRKLLEDSPGIVVEDNPERDEYPMPLNAHEQDHVYIGRLREDHSQHNTFNMWIVSDNLRKGAATNAIQIAELLVAKGFF
jgi:aspartate-semialdehyde dehydrogenase